MFISVAWQFMSSSFLEEPSCHADPLFIELYLFAVWALDAFVVNYHLVWQEALSTGASREAWQKIKCLLTWGGKKRKPRPHARKCG